jgi:hypothetical protein
MPNTAPAATIHHSNHTQQQQQAALRPSAASEGLISGPLSQSKSPDLQKFLFNEATGMLSTGSSKGSTPSTSTGGAGRSLAAAAAVGSMGLAHLAAAQTNNVERINLQGQGLEGSNDASCSSSSVKRNTAVRPVSPISRNALQSGAQSTSSNTTSRAITAEEIGDWGSRARAAGGTTGRGANVSSAPCGLGSLDDQMRANSPSTASAAGSPSRSMSTKRKVVDVSVSGAAGGQATGCELMLGRLSCQHVPESYCIVQDLLLAYALT